MATNLTDRTRRIIRADGTVQALDRPHSYDEIRKLIGAVVTDSVSLRHLGDPLVVMMVNDHGYDTEAVTEAGDWQGMPAEVTTLKPTRALLPVNSLATELYHANCLPGTTYQIVGDVAIVPDTDFA
jgi:hypothetical protein